jgi:exopolyphosphatase/guanosine-5'-triphosphate,3'-diphosphate pyrophosphatase
VTPRLAQQSGRGTDSRTVAVCDLGTYSGLILIARRSGRRWSVLVEERHTLDLLSGSGWDRLLHHRAFERAATLLERFEAVAGQFGEIKGAIVCTSAVRQAVNRERFLVSLRKVTRFPIRTLSARQEASLSALGALIGLRLSQRPTAVVDIGGGSTEVVFLNAGRHRFWLTDWGAARATGDWQRISPVPPDQRAKSFGQKAAIIMQDLPVRDHPFSRVIGVGGTIVTLAALCTGLAEFDPRSLHGMTLERRWIEHMGKQLATMNQRAIARLIPFDPGRARVLTAGTFLWAGVLNRLGADRVTVSVRGLRWGVAARLVEGRRV